MKILITGATGFIGSNLVNELTRYKHKLFLLVRDKKRIKNIQSNSKIIEIDLTNKKELSEKLKTIPPIDIVYNVAGKLESHNDSYNELYNYNVKITENLIEVLNKRIKKLVHVSSEASMGKVETKVDESIKCNPVTNYDKAKLASEIAVRDLCKKYKIDFIILRPTMVYGPGEIKNKLKLFKLIKKKKFIIPGNGKNKLSLVYIDNLTKAMIKFLNKKENNEMYIISDRNDYTFNQIINTIADTLNVRRPIHMPIIFFSLVTHLLEFISLFTHKEPILNKNRLNNLISNHTFDIHKAINKLNYDPKVNLEEGIKITAQWYKENGYLQ